MRTAGETGVFNNSFGICLAFASRKSGDIAFWTRKGFAVFFLLIIGDQCHMIGLLF